MLLFYQRWYLSSTGFVIVELFKQKVNAMSICQTYIDILGLQTIARQ